MLEETLTREITLRPLGPFKHISNIVYYGMTDRGLLHVFFSTKDRRKARRVSRKLKIRFKRGTDGYIEFK